MSGVSDVRKAFEDSLRKIDELIEGLRAERDRIRAEFCVREHGYSSH